MGKRQWSRVGMWLRQHHTAAVPVWAQEALPPIRRSSCTGAPPTHRPWTHWGWLISHYSCPAREKWHHTPSAKWTRTWTLAWYSFFLSIFQLISHSDSLSLFYCSRIVFLFSSLPLCSVSTIFSFFFVSFCFPIIPSSFFFCIFVFCGFGFPVFECQLNIGFWITVDSMFTFVCLFLYIIQWGPALYLCYKRAVAKANALVYEAGEWDFFCVCLMWLWL